MSNIFIQLAIILTLASSLGLVTYKLKLPIIIAYLFGGLLLALSTNFDVSKATAFSFLPDIGIAFVLFLVGMELDFREIRKFGKQIITAGTLQVIITATLGTFLAQNFGFDLRQALYLGFGLSFSSTLVVVKLLSERKDLTSLYGKLSLGVLLLEDLLAVIILLGLTSSVPFLNPELGAFPVYVFAVKVVLLFLCAWIFGKYILTWIFKAVSASSELLFLSALAWCFAYISFSMYLGFSVLIGAFIAGVALASSPYHFQIQGKIKPMRDFFLALFFVYLGTRVNFADIGKVYPLILSFAVYATIAKPLIFLLIFGMFGFKKHTMFKTAINLSQVSEFSLIILLVGLKLGIVTQAALTVVALASVLSFVASSLMISQAGKIYKLTEKLVEFFERKNAGGFEEGKENQLKDHIIVIGAHRVGGELVRFLKKEKIPMVVLDFNPHQVETLLKEGIPVIYGDMSDPEIMDILDLENARMVISTSNDLADNRLLLENIKARHKHIPIILRAAKVEDAQRLYRLGADYVIIPDILAGDVLVDKLKDHINDREFFHDRPRIEMEKLSRKILAWD